MKILNELENKLNHDIQLRFLMKVALFFVIVWLFMETASLWKSVVQTGWSIVCPFVIGFVMAYILRQPIVWFEKRKVSRKIMIPILYFVILTFILWLLSTLIPLVLSRSVNLLNSMIGGLNWIYERIAMASAQGAPEWFSSFVDSIITALRDAKTVLPALSDAIPVLLQSAVTFITNSIFALIVSVFMGFQWENICKSIVSLTSKVSMRFSRCTFAINEKVGEYIHSILILMMIRFFEYSIVYLVVGHPDWMILALLTSISLLIPYLGPTVINCIGILTSFTLSGTQVMLLVFFIVVLSFVDEYVIAPLVHSHNTGVSPLWTLFSIFAGGVLFGPIGIVIAIPVYLMIRTIYEFYFESSEQFIKEKEEIRS